MDKNGKLLLVPDLLLGHSVFFFFFVCLFSLKIVSNSYLVIKLEFVIQPRKEVEISPAVLNHQAELSDRQLFFFFLEGGGGVVLGHARIYFISIFFIFKFWSNI